MQSVLENAEQITVSEKRTSLKKIGCATATILAVLLGTIAVFVYRSVYWVLDTWSDLSMEEIVYHLQMPLEGTNGDMITDFIICCVLAAIMAMIGLIVVFIFLRKKKIF